MRVVDSEWGLEGGSWGLRLRVQGFKYRVWGLDLGVGMWGFESRD